MKGGPRHGEFIRGGIGLLLLTVFVHAGRAAVVDIYTDGVVDPEWMDWSFGYLDRNIAAEYNDGNQTVTEYCISLEPYGALSFASLSGASIPVNGTTLDMRIRINESSVADVGSIVGNIHIMVEYADKATAPVALRELLGSSASQESDDAMQYVVDGEYVDIKIDTQELVGSAMMDSFNQVTLGACLVNTPDCSPRSSICTSSLTLRTTTL